MRAWYNILLFLLLLPATAPAEVGRKIDPLPCGIYDQEAHSLIEKDLDTQSADRPHYTMEMTTSSGRQLRVEVRSVDILMSGERNHVSVFLDGKPFAKTSHQDVPLYLEVHVDGVRYRIICVRAEDGELLKQKFFSGGVRSNPPGADEDGQVTSKRRMKTESGNAAGK